MKWGLLISMLALPAAAAEETARAFWDAVLGCWAVKGGAAASEQGWSLYRDWTATCGDCAEEVQLWDAGAGFRIVRERSGDADLATCALDAATWPRVTAVLPGLRDIWGAEGLDWIAQDLNRPEAPFAVLISCEPELAARKVAVLDAAGGALRFSVTSWTPDHAALCAGAAG